LPVRLTLLSLGENDGIGLPHAPNQYNLEGAFARLAEGHDATITRPEPYFRVPTGGPDPGGFDKNTCSSISKGYAHHLVKHLRKKL